MCLRFFTNKKIVKKTDIAARIDYSFFKFYRQSLFFLSCVIFLSSVIASQAFASCFSDENCDGIYEGKKSVTWDSENRQCKSEELGFFGHDFYLDLTNPVCIASTSSAAAAASGLSYAAAIPTFGLSLIAGAALQATTQNMAFGVTYGIASQVYKKARICGHDWQVWSQIDNEGRPIKDSKGELLWGRGLYIDIFEHKNNSYAKCLVDLFTENDSCRFRNKEKKITNQYYREYIYGGKEYEDNGSDACALPKSWDDRQRDLILGYHQGKQRYYMRGPGLASNYACNRFLLGGSDQDEVRAAYNCCKQRSQNTICIEYQPALFSNNWSFCRIGKTCAINGVHFEAYKAKITSNYICAKTYSLCPYNHTIGGGSEIEDSDPETGARKNFCQYMNHCVKIPLVPYISEHNHLSGKFVSKSCKDLKGDSQNSYIHDFGLLPIGGHNFSAPIIQCFKETIENLMVNRATDTACLDSKEKPSKEGVCLSGYQYKEGEIIASESFFVNLQNRFQSVVKMSLVLAIMFFGGCLLLGLGEVKQKKLIPFIIKIALVVYFASGDGWQSIFMDGVTKTSNLLSEIVMTIDQGNKDPVRQDGCQFPKFNYKDIKDTNPANFAYPPSKEYLRIWDILDCKISRAIGFAPEVSVPNLMMMILAGFLTGGAGIVFLVAILVFAFFLIFVVIRAIHIFLISSIGITLLIYISPLTITLSLFEKTKAVFDNWYRQLLGLILQPMILFAYLGLLVTIFDSVIVGDVTFSGDGRNAPKEIHCNQKAKINSVYCIFNLVEIKTLNSFSHIGIGLPALASKNLEQKTISLFKAALLMFIFAKFLDHIQELAISLVGGPLMSPNWGSTEKMASKTYRTLRDIQKRGVRSIKKHGTKVTRSAGHKIATHGNLGKNVTIRRGN